MQRRDPKGFLEGVMADVPDLSPEIKEQLLGIVGDKVGTKRAARIASILAGLESSPPPRAAERAVEEPAPAAPASPTLAPPEASEEAEAAPPAPAPPPPPAAKPKRARAKKAPPPPPKGNLNPFAGEVGDDEEPGQ